MSPATYRLIERVGGLRPGVREVVPETVAEEEMKHGRAHGLRLVRFLAVQLPYAPGETAAFRDHVAEQLIRLHWAEPVPVRPPDADQGVEAKAIDRPPVDRMVRHANTKEVKP